MYLVSRQSYKPTWVVLFTNSAQVVLLLLALRWLPLQCIVVKQLLNQIHVRLQVQWGVECGAQRPRPVPRDQHPRLQVLHQDDQPCPSP